MLCASSFYESIRKNNIFGWHAPLDGCPDRTQTIGDMLNKASAAVLGRSWALPKGARENITIPMGMKSQSDAITNLQEMPKWKFHVAAYAEDIDGNKIVLDPAVFDGPVDFDEWKKRFNPKDTHCKTTNWWEAPLYDWGGSCYAPDHMHESSLRDGDPSRYAVAQLAALQKEPAHPFKIDRFQAPAKRFFLKVKPSATALPP